MTNTNTSAAGNGSDQMMTADVQALVPGRIGANEGEIIDAPFGGSGRRTQTSGLRSETYVSAVNGGQHLYVYLGAALLNGEYGALNHPYAQARWQKIDGKVCVLRLRLGDSGCKLRQRRCRPHFPIPVPARVGTVARSRGATPIDSWFDTESHEMCVRVDSFFSDGE